MYLPLMLLSIGVNYFLTKQMDHRPLYKKSFLTIGLFFNVGLLLYFKYADFFIVNTNAVLSSDISLLHLALPLGISFFTIQQIAFLIDSYGGLVKEKSFSDYILFVVFFPQLIAGPIVHHKEMMPQFATVKNKIINYNNIATGLFIFSIGLFKKVVIADTFAQWATSGFSAAHQLNMLEAWVTSLSYTFQLYFDFSGYTDMAIGAALLFNIKLPQNFNSPYKAISIIEFWSRWHMTLTRFLTTYIYGPTVKSFRKFSFNKAMFATFITMFVAGIWHGAAWTFILFGAVHGIAIVVNHYAKRQKIKINKILSWLITFNFLNMTFVIFRANNLNDAAAILKAMFTGNLILPEKHLAFLSQYQNSFFKFGTVYEHIAAKPNTFIYIILAFILVLFFKNSNELLQKFNTTLFNLILSIFLLFISLSMMSSVSEFLYYNF